MDSNQKFWTIFWLTITIGLVSCEAIDVFGNQHSPEKVSQEGPPSKELVYEFLHTTIAN